MKCPNVNTALGHFHLYESEGGNAMAIRIILVISFGIVLPIMYFVLRHYANPKGQQIFGVTVGAHHFNDEEVIRIQKHYKTELNWWALIMLAILIGAIFVPYFSICYTILIFWMLFVIVVFYLPFMRANSAVKRLKLERGWNGEASGRIVLEQKMELIKEQIVAKRVFVLAGILSVVPLLIYLVLFAMGKAEGTDFFPAACLCGVAVLIEVLGIAVQRIRYKTGDQESCVKQAIAKRKRYYWGKGMAGCALATSLYCVFLAIEYFEGQISVLAVILVTLAYILFVTCWLFYTFYKADQIPTESTSEDAMLEDDDDHWIYGLFYYNKKDPSFMVEKKIGIGTTVNMARPSAKAGAVILALCLLLMPLSSVWMIGDEFTPIRLSITEQTVECSQFEGTYSIDIGSIKKAEAVTELPRTRKQNGAALDNLYRGSFRVDGYGRCKVCLDPRNTYFIILTLEDDKVYIFSDQTDEGTKDVYDKLLLQL